MIIPAAVLVALSAYLLQGDVWTFWTWYLLALVLGVAAMPLTGRLFRRFDDLHCSFYIIIPKRTERRIRVYSFCTS